MPGLSTRYRGISAPVAPISSQIALPDFFLPESAHGLSILKTPVLHSGCDKIRPCYIGS